jgi:DNA topoisomerase-6 subunit A
MAKMKQTRNGTAEKKVIGLADLVVTAAQRAKDPTMAIPIRALSNVTFNERKGQLEMGNKTQSRSFFRLFSLVSG